MSTTRRFPTAIFLSLTLGCTAEFPLNPSNTLGLTENLENLLGDVNRALTDPLDVHPDHVLVSGDNQRVFYATDLLESEISFPGPANNITIPSFVGPSTIYGFEKNERFVVKRLADTAALYRLATNGSSVAFVRKVGLGTGDATSELVLNGQVLLTLPADSQALISSVLLDSNALIAVISPFEFDALPTIKIFDPIAGAETFSYSTNLTSFNLFGETLAQWVRTGDTKDQLELMNVLTGEKTVVAETTTEPTSVFISANRIVWSEYLEYGRVRVRSVDRSTHDIITLAESIDGSLAGANDNYFVIEVDYVANNEITNRVAIQQIDNQGKSKELANFRRDGRAGQTRVFGDRVVFVNDDRKIVVVPLANSGERFNFDPY